MLRLFSTRRPTSSSQIVILFSKPNIYNNVYQFFINLELITQNKTDSKLKPYCLHYVTFLFCNQYKYSYCCFVIDELTILDNLPYKMKTDVAINVHINTLNKVQLFKHCDDALLRDLVLKLRPVVYLPGDYICKKVCTYRQ